jgi:hypothetical protein
MQKKKNERCTCVFLNLGPKKHLQNLKKRKEKGKSNQYVNKKKAPAQNFLKHCSN